MLSGPIDIDKIDYLMRDSLHAGVPYGQHFDRGRLIGSLCLNEAGDGLAITDKGKTAAEMMVFARYVMFSEVYWHHAVRSATAMLQRAFYLLRDALDLDRLVTLTEQPMIDALLAAGGRRPGRRACSTACSARRGGSTSGWPNTATSKSRSCTAAGPAAVSELVACRRADRGDVGRRRWAEQVAPHEVLVDAPPVELEVEFDIEVYFPKQNVYRPLGEVSPVVRTLAQEQFDDYVKRVRIFVHPRIADIARRQTDLSERLAEAIERA